MTFLRSTTNRIRMLALLMLAGATLSACAPTPEPTPTPTAAFASEEEAFAAAEATFASYTDALSRVVLTEPGSLEEVYTWLVDDAESTSRETLSQLAAEELTLTGATTYTRFEGVIADLSTGTINASVCLDVTLVDVLDSAGRSVVSAERPNLQPLDVVFVAASTSSGLAIASTRPSEKDACAP